MTTYKLSHTSLEAHVDGDGVRWSRQTAIVFLPGGDRLTVAGGRRRWVLDKIRVEISASAIDDLADTDDGISVKLRGRPITSSGQPDKRVTVGAATIGPLDPESIDAVRHIVPAVVVSVPVAAVYSVVVVVTGEMVATELRRQLDDLRDRAHPGRGVGRR